MRLCHLLAVFALACASPPKAERPTPRLLALQSAEAEEIAQLEDARLLGGGRLEALTRAPAPAIRARALLALGRLSVPETLGVVAAGLDDPEPDVRAAAAFSLGAMALSWEPLPEERRALAEARLLARLKVEQTPRVLTALLEALGRAGGPDAVEPLAQQLARPGAHRAAAALSLGVLARRSDGKVRISRGLSTLLALVRADDEALSFAAAYALAYSGMPEARPALLSCLTRAGVEARGICAKGLASDGPDHAELEVLVQAVSDTDERVAAEAARSLAKRATRCAPASPCPALAALRRVPVPWRPSVVEAVATEPLTGAAAAALFRAQLGAIEATAAAAPRSCSPEAGGPRCPEVKAGEGAEHPAGAGRWPRAHCDAALGHDRALGRTEALPACGLGAIGEADRRVLQVRALAEGPGEAGGRAAAILALVKESEPRVRAEAVRALAGLGAAAAPLVFEMLGADDPQVAGAAAEACESLSLKEAGAPLATVLERLHGEAASEAIVAALSAVAALGYREAMPAIRGLLKSEDPQVRAAAARALVKLGEAQPAIAPPPWPAGPYASERVSDRPFARIHTSRGVVRVQLLAHEAPMTVRNFVHLARRGFYDGLTFHRVVPAFVAQGGDPHGDGSGGPGWSIRCEVNPRRFGTGAVGMALGGKDTGGSQFFFTHLPQPHLDGRFTVFGQIVSGLEVSTSLMPGDRILRVEIE